MKKIYNKLVRDNIINIIERKGEKPTYRVLNNDEYIYELNKKLLEESKELAHAREFKDVIEEMADVFEVLLSLAKIHEINLEELEKTRIAKSDKNGAFEKKLYLETVEEEDR